MGHAQALLMSAVSRAGVPLVHLRPAQVSLDLQRMLASHLPSSSHLNRKPQVGCNVVLFLNKTKFCLRQLSQLADGGSIYLVFR